MQDLALEAMQEDDPDTFRCTALLLARLSLMPKAVFKDRGHALRKTTLDTSGVLLCC